MTRPAPAAGQAPVPADAVRPAAFSMDRVRGFACGSAANLASVLTGTWRGLGGMNVRMCSGDRRVVASVAVFSPAGMLRALCVRTWAPDSAGRTCETGRFMMLDWNRAASLKPAR